jgi:hypothetical protein
MRAWYGIWIAWREGVGGVGVGVGGAAGVAVCVKWFCSASFGSSYV